VLVLLVSGFALLRRKLWGWWLALVTDLLLLSMLVYSMVDEGWHIDWEMAGYTAMSVIIPMLLLLPTVRRFYWHAPAIEGVQLSS